MPEKEDQLINTLERMSESLNDTLLGALEDNSYPRINVTDALISISNSIDRSIRLLGLNDASTSMGTIESLGKAVIDGSEKIAAALYDVAAAIRKEEPAIDGDSDG